jgi:hypothetical protein
VSTTEVAAVIVAGASVLGVVVLALFLARVNRTLREVGESVHHLRLESTPVDARSQLVSGEPTRRGQSRDAGTLVARVARANPYLDVSDPVIKVLALASGTSRAASRFRRTRQER